jgi:hypothetical protein
MFIDQRAGDGDEEAAAIAGSSTHNALEVWQQREIVTDKTERGNKPKPR